MALPTHIDLQVLTPDRGIIRDRVDEVEIPGSEGYFGVLPGHRPMLASLTVGELWYRKGEEKYYLAITLGFAEVLPDRVTILAPVAERAEDIDITRAEASKRRAEERLARPSTDMDFDRPRIAMLRAIPRLEVSHRARTRG